MKNVKKYWQRYPKNNNFYSKNKEKDMRNYTKGAAE